jgi:protein-tyrosine phosphatase
MNATPVAGEGMVDVHCHLLPGVDDGANSWETTLEMCRLAQQDGVAHIVATPHANYEYAYDRGSHLALLDELRVRFPALSFSLGCDFHLSYDNVQDAMQHPGRYAIGDSHYLLVELSDYSTFNAAQMLYDLQTAGLIPILTHPERNPIILGKPESLQEFADLGCLIQITANSLTGFWGKQPQKFCQEMLRKELVHFIASDAHGVKARAPILSAARNAAAKIVGAARAERLVSSNPADVVAGRSLDFAARPTPSVKR